MIRTTSSSVGPPRREHPTPRLFAHVCTDRATTLLRLSAATFAAIIVAITSPVTVTAHAAAYNGVMAAQWAYDNLDEPYLFPDDCTYFVSQALWAGGLSPTP